jgi:hypothetical protein
MTFGISADLNAEMPGQDKRRFGEFRRAAGSLL